MPSRRGRRERACSCRVPVSPLGCSSLGSSANKKAPSGRSCGDLGRSRHWLRESSARFPVRSYRHTASPASVGCRYRQCTRRRRHDPVPKVPTEGGSGSIQCGTGRGDVVDQHRSVRRVFRARREAGGVALRPLAHRMAGPPRPRAQHPQDGQTGDAAQRNGEFDGRVDPERKRRKAARGTGMRAAVPAGSRRAIPSARKEAAAGIP